MMPQPTTLPRAVVITRLNKTTITEQWHTSRNDVEIN
jgi:hypothetical protein